MKFEENKVIEAFERGEKRGKEEKYIPVNWFDYFGFRGNPFPYELPLDPLNREKDLDLFINRENKLEKLAEYIGMAEKIRNPFHIAVIGAEGIGKRSLTRVLNYFAYKKRDYKGEIFDVDQAEYIHPKSKEPNKNDPIPLPTKDLRYQILEVCSKNPQRAMNRLKKGREYNILSISLWNPDSIPSDLKVERKLFLKAFSENEIKELIYSRITSVGGKKEVITPEALKIITKKCLGVPKLAISLTENAFQRVFQKEKKKYVDVAAVKEAVGHWDYLDIEEKLNLTAKEKEVLEILKQYMIKKDKKRISPPTLAEISTMDRVLAWKYLERLHEKGLLRKKYIGRKSVFSFTLPARIKLQLMDYGGEKK